MAYRKFSDEGGQNRPKYTGERRTAADKGRAHGPRSPVLTGAASPTPTGTTDPAGNG